MSIDRRRFLGLLSSFAPAAIGATEGAAFTQLVTARKYSSDTWGFAIEGPTSVIGIVVGCDRWPNQAACRAAQRQVEELGREGFSSAFRVLDFEIPAPLLAADWALIAANGDDPQNLDSARRLAMLYKSGGITPIVLAMRDQEAVWLMSSLRNEPKQGETPLGFDALPLGQSDAPALFEMVTLDPLFDLLRMCELLSRSSEGLFGVDPNVAKSLLSPGRQGLTSEAGAGGPHRAYVAADLAIDDIAEMAGARWRHHQLDMVTWIRLATGAAMLREIRSVMDRLRIRAGQLGNLRTVSFGHVRSDDDPFLTVRVYLSPICRLAGIKSR
jgi:hypothetical protein